MVRTVDDTNSPVGLIHRVDVMGAVRSADWRSALILISEADTDEHLQLIDSGVLKQLIAEKWKHFAKVCSH